MSGADHAAYARLATLIAEAPHNLVSRRERDTVLDVHVPECLGIGKILAPRPGQRWVDLGTGGGLPGLVLAIANPAVEWTLVDATAKKVAAVAEFAADLGLDNVVPVSGRAEDLARAPVHRGRYDGVVSRALARLVVACELSRGFAGPGAMVAAVKGRRWREEVAEAAPVLPRLSLGVPRAHEVPGAVRPSVVVTMRADGPVPPEVPRRVGLPAAQPLGIRSP